MMAILFEWTRPEEDGGSSDIVFTGFDSLFEICSRHECTAISKSDAILLAKKILDAYGEVE